MEVKHILVPFTGTEEEKDTFEFTCKIAKAIKARLSVVYALEVPLSFSIDSADVPGLKEVEKFLEQAERIAENVGIQIDTDIVQTRDAGVGIVEEARTIHADLIVVSGRYDISHPDTPIGHTIRYLLKHSPCPVWISYKPSHETEPKQR